MGHDGDESAGHAVHAQEQASGTAQGRANEDPAEAGACDLWCGDEDRQ
ncbi:hypothetical protein SDC9_146144 [bioreactor metagenome]|uniref:Uncharacterized protein n=1 Tax=bioreactor metagenome TaxID=1076179 RepID=A0A645EA99_9ZZZZ